MIKKLQLHGNLQYLYYLCHYLLIIINNLNYYLLGHSPTLFNQLSEWLGYTILGFTIKAPSN